MLWVALGLRSKPLDNAALEALKQSKRWPLFRTAASVTALLTFITAMSGAFVAGMLYPLLFIELEFDLFLLL